MSDYDEFLRESELFLAQLETSVPPIAAHTSGGAQFIRRTMGVHFVRIRNTASAFYFVNELKDFCLELSQWPFPILEPVIRRYLNVLEHTDFDVAQRIELLHGISALRNHFDDASDRIMAELASPAWELRPAVNPSVTETGPLGGQQQGRRQIQQQRELRPQQQSQQRQSPEKLQQTQQQQRPEEQGPEKQSGQPQPQLPAGGTDGDASSINAFDAMATASFAISAAAAPQPREPAMRVRLEGDKVKGRVVERGSYCVLTVDWGLPDERTIGELAGHELQRAREAGLELVFVLYRGPFKVEGNQTRITTRFKADQFETPVEFKLTAPDKLPGPGNTAMKAKLYLEIEIQGRPAVRIAVLVTVVYDLSTASAGVAAAPLKIDLDKLIAGAARPGPAGVLRIDSTGSASAELTLLRSGEVFAARHDALAQLSIANQLGKIARKMDEVAKDLVWNLLSDPLKPAAAELPALSEPLAKTAAAGYALHEWLAMSAGMKEILDRIDALPIGSRIIVRSDGVAIPWEALYPLRYRFEPSGGDAAADVDIAKFWGYRFEFETILSPGWHELPDGDTDRIEQHRGARRKLTAVLNGDIDLEMQWKAGPPVDYQRAAFVKASDRGLMEMQFKNVCADAKRMVDTEPTDGSFIYFYCHGGAERPFDPSLVEILKIDKQCQIEDADVSHDATFTDAPIVFLNSCSSGPLASVSFDSFCARFLHKGALGLITTSFAVPAPFAARFGAELILRYMNAHETLGAVLLDLRRKALNEQIPIGLFYMLRGPADASLQDN